MMIKKFLHKYVILIIILILIVCASNIQWGKNSWKNIIKADGKGYYAYLPAIFIYHDLNFSFFDSIEKKYPNPNIFYDYRVVNNERIVDKYFAGTALAIAPFFLVAHVISNLMGIPTDGYSKIYLILISIAAIIYLFIGLFYLKNLLQRYGASNDLISFILIAITFATNIFYYTVCEPALSHIYSFTYITILLYNMHIYFSTPTKQSVFIIAALLGIITLIRPPNSMIILIAPFIAGNKKIFSDGINYLKTNLLPTIVGALFFLLIISIQLLLYKIQTGNFWVDSYGNEKFNWADPQMINFLFSYKKGLFIYTPLTFITLLGLYKLFKENKFQFFSLSAFLFLLLYVLSSWWNWWYGGSFSSRVCIEYYAIVALLMYFTFNLLGSIWGRITYFSLIIGLLLICQIQTYQYRYYFIHWEKMDKKHYWNTFLRLNMETNPNADLLYQL